MSEREPGRPPDREPTPDPYGPPPAEPPPQPAAAPGERGRPWSAGRVIALVIGSLLALLALGLLAAGIVGLVIDQTQRDDAGYIVTDDIELESGNHAIVGTGLRIAGGPDWAQARRVTGNIQLRVEAVDGGPVFVGVAREQAARDYLADLGYDEVTRIGGGEVTYRAQPGGEPETPPGDQDFWSESTEGPGLQTLTFQPETGRWVIIAMNADGSAGVDVFGSLAAELPILPGFSIGFIIAGAVLLLLAALLILLAARRT